MHGRVIGCLTGNLGSTVTLPIDQRPGEEITPPTDQAEPTVAVTPQPVGQEISYPAWMAPAGPSSPLPQQPWISPIQLLMRTMLETDTDRFVPPATMDVDVKYYLAPPLPQPAVLPSMTTSARLAPSRSSAEAEPAT